MRNYWYPFAVGLLFLVMVIIYPFPWEYPFVLWSTLLPFCFGTVIITGISISQLAEQPEIITDSCILEALSHGKYIHHATN